MTESPTILAIETATSSCSVALTFDGQTDARTVVGNNIHSQVLLSMVAELFEQFAIDANSLDAVAVGQGPGSFTGLRIGVGVGQGIAYGAGCPMIGVSSLDALALQASVDGSVIAAIDARMGEVYWCEYLVDGTDVSRQGDLRVTHAADITALDNAVLVGNARIEHDAQFSAELLTRIVWIDAVTYPDAAALLTLAQQKFECNDWVTAAEFAPIYVRNNVAKKAKPRA